MKNSDRFIKICNSLKLETIDIVEMLALSQVEKTEEEVEAILDDEAEVDFELVESFLNGLIVFNRGENNNGKKRVPTTVEDPRSINNVVLKKIKIAFSLDTEGMLELLNEGEIKTSKEKLSSLFRKEGHKSYKYCRDVYINEFLNALSNRDMF
jgi:uncharacterized protein YehS (DUF1456 family)